MLITRLAVFIPLVLACNDEPEQLPIPEGGPFNVLVILGDDIGKERISAYGGDVSTPNIDSLADNGVRFERAYSNPTCSPSRASLLTGRHPSRTGLGRWLFAATGTDGLRRSETTLPELLDDSEFLYTSSAVGKWHLNTAQAPDYAASPLDAGFSYYAGGLANPRESAGLEHTDADPALGYYFWEKSTNGALSWEETYYTTDTTDEAVAQLQTLPEPWFLWVAYAAAHEPWHLPPEELHDYELDTSASIPERMDAMVQAMDREIGRLLSALDDEVRSRTVVIYASDNGPTEQVAPPFPDERTKGSAYDGAVNVPFVVSGPVVAQPGRVSDAFVHFVDVFALVAQLAGVAIDEERVDGRSFLPVLQDPSDHGSRDTVFTEGFFPNGPGRAHDGDEGERSFARRMVRDAEWKYLLHIEAGAIGDEGLFRYDDPGSIDEGDNLLVDGEDALSDEERDALTRLRGLLEEELARLR